jgi:hypothetical protein
VNCEFVTKRQATTANPNSDGAPASHCFQSKVKQRTKQQSKQQRIMNQLALQVVGGSIVPLLSLGFRWLQNRAAPLYYRIIRWWGGNQKLNEVWEAYKEVRKEIMDQEPNNDMRLALLRDVRVDFRLKYPAYADLWN